MFMVICELQFLTNSAATDDSTVSVADSKVSKKNGLMSVSRESVSHFSLRKLPDNQSCVLSKESHVRGGAGARWGGQTSRDNPILENRRFFLKVKPGLTGNRAGR